MVLLMIVGYIVLGICLNNSINWSSDWCVKIKGLCQGKSNNDLEEHMCHPPNYNYNRPIYNPTLNKNKSCKDWTLTYSKLKDDQTKTFNVSVKSIPSNSRKSVNKLDCSQDSTQSKIYQKNIGAIPLLSMELNKQSIEQALMLPLGNKGV